MKQQKAVGFNRKGSVISEQMQGFLEGFQEDTMKTLDVEK
jgi:hypothetical protein